VPCGSTVVADLGPKMLVARGPWRVAPVPGARRLRQQGLGRCGVFADRGGLILGWSRSVVLPVDAFSPTSGESFFGTRAFGAWLPYGAITCSRFEGETGDARTRLLI
jgi:hypothetical protein